MTGDFLGASLGPQSGVSPFRARWRGGVQMGSGLSDDVLLDDGQWCASAGYSEVGRRPEVAAHAGADAAADEFVSPHCVGGATIQALYECRDCHCGRVGDEKVHVVGFAVELDQLDIEIGAHVVHGVLGEGEDLVGEHRAPILGREHQMCMQQRHAVPGMAIGLGCHRSALQSQNADALSVPHRTDTSSAADAGAGVRVLPGGVQRRTARTRRGVSGRGEAVGQRDSTPGDHRRPRQRPSGRGWARCRVWLWCSRSTTPVVPGGISSTRPTGNARAARWAGRA